jgi:hypothetical protein
MFTAGSLVQLANALAPMKLTVLPKVTLKRFVQLANALAPMVVVPGGTKVEEAPAMFTLARLVQP